MPTDHFTAPTPDVNACRCECGVVTGIDPFPWRRVPCPSCRPADHEREMSRLRGVSAAIDRNAARNDGGR